MSTKNSNNCSECGNTLDITGTCTDCGFWDDGKTRHEMTIWEEEEILRNVCRSCIRVHHTSYMKKKHYCENCYRTVRAEFYDRKLEVGKYYLNYDGSEWILLQHKKKWRIFKGKISFLDNEFKSKEQAVWFLIDYLLNSPIGKGYSRGNY